MYDLIQNSWPRYQVISDPKQREAYDATLAKERERMELVDARPATMKCHTGPFRAC